jgi:hypothetical protein
MAATPKSRMSSAGERAPSTKLGKTTICSASATTARIMAVRKRGPGEIVIVASVMALITSPLVSILSDAIARIEVTVETCGPRLFLSRRLGQEPRHIEAFPGPIFACSLPDRGPDCDTSHHPPASLVSSKLAPVWEPVLSNFRTKGRRLRIQHDKHRK